MCESCWAFCMICTVVEMTNFVPLTGTTPMKAGGSQWYHRILQDLGHEKAATSASQSVNMS